MVVRDRLIREDWHEPGLDAFKPERPQTLIGWGEEEPMPRLGPPQSASIVGRLSVKIKWLEVVWRRLRNTDAHSLASRTTSLDW